MTKQLLSLIIILLGWNSSQANTDSLITKDAIYDRPFINIAKTRTALGGYIEGNTNYFATDGVTDGFSMELRRFNIFLYSAISDRIKFLSELEFEHGVEEIKLETALLDFEINPAFNFRAGIFLVPIGAFNQNHDSPKWEFIDRPLVSTNIIPATLSEVGFGIHGKFITGPYILAYETYLSNGLRDGIINNGRGRTYIPDGRSEEMFSEDNNGLPMYSGKISLKKRRLAELGISYYGGVYNTFRIEGIPVDRKRRLDIWAADLNTSIGKLAINAEAAFANIQLAPTVGPFFGDQQWGFYAEGIYPVVKRKIFGYPNSIINVCLRTESIDFNMGTLGGDKLYDEVKAIVPGISFRPSANTVLKANYRYHWERDLLGNPTVRTAGFQVGVASYF